MPFYSYHCKRCDAVQTAYRNISGRHDGPDCCEEKTLLCIVAPAVTPDLPGYESPITGKWVEGKASRREDLRRSGCRPYESPTEERQEAARQTKYNDEKQSKQLHEMVAKEYYALSPQKQRILRNG